MGLVDKKKKKPPGENGGENKRGAKGTRAVNSTCRKSKNKLVFF